MCPSRRLKTQTIQHAGNLKGETSTRNCLARNHLITQPLHQAATPPRKTSAQTTVHSLNMSARNTKVKRSFDTRTFGLHKKATELHKLSGANALVLTLYEGKLRCFSSHSANEWPIIRPIIEQLSIGDTLLGPGHFTSVSEHMSLPRGSSIISDGDVVSTSAVLTKPLNPHLNLPSNPGHLAPLDDDAVRQSYLVDLENLQSLQSGQSPVGQSVITRPDLSRPPTPPLTPSPPTTPSLPAIQDRSEEEWACYNSKVLQDVNDSFSLGSPLLFQSLKTDTVAEPIDPAKSAPLRRSSKEHRKRKRGTGDSPSKKRKGNPALTSTRRNAPAFS